MKADAKTVAAVRDLLEEYAGALSRGDLDTVMAMFAKEPGLVHIGTGADEWCEGCGELREQFWRVVEQSEGLRLQFANLHVSQAGRVCWLSSNAKVSAKVTGQDRTYDVRATAVLEKRGDNWYFVQTHFSLPADQETGKSFPNG